MNKGIVVTILTVLYFLWNIFAGIKLAWGGILMLIWGGRINIILFLIFALLFILIGLTDKKEAFLHQSTSDMHFHLY